MINIKVSFNNQNAEQNFWMAICSSVFTDKIISNRTTRQWMVKLEKIFKTADANKGIDVILFKNKENNISAVIFSTGLDGFVKASVKIY